ncbi:MAG TPA: hypothetical protein PLQ36_02980, partial [Candidatus Gracilibacteria bacterium]|nr:hypothetical protein [Candidatus Gracilibacteria bacterium]
MLNDFLALIDLLNNLHQDDFSILVKSSDLEGINTDFQKNHPAHFFQVNSPLLRDIMESAIALAQTGQSVFILHRGSNFLTNTFDLWQNLVIPYHLNLKLICTESGFNNLKPQKDYPQIDDLALSTNLLNFVSL